MHVDDLASACVHLMKHYDSPEIINVGTGEDLTIADLARLVRETVGYTGGLEFDSSKPDGTPRKLLDVSRLHSTGWRHSIDLKTGLRQTYEWYLQDQRRA
jgi:GDP-L-fucose synthase